MTMTDRSGLARLSVRRTAWGLADLWLRLRLVAYLHGNWAVDACEGLVGGYEGNGRERNGRCVLYYRIIKPMDW